MFLCMFWSVEGFLFRFFLHSTNLNHSLYLCRVFQMLTTDQEVVSVRRTASGKSNVASC